MLSGRLLRLVVATLALALAAVATAATWPIMVDGKQVDAPWYALSDNADALAVGDALYVGNENGGLWLCVRDTENLHFVNRLRPEALLYRQVGEKLELVGFSGDSWSPHRTRAEATTAAENEAEPAPPSIRSLGSKAIGGLWGLSLVIDEQAAEVLQQVQTSQTFCSLKYRSWAQEPARLPARSYRALAWSGAPDESLYAGLTGELRLFALERWTHAEQKFDLRRLEAGHELKVLRLRSVDAEHVDALKELVRLRLLDLSYNQSIDTVTWASQMPDLRELDLSFTPVQDLSPLRNWGGCRG